jgi:hypothetical protein
MKVESYPFAIRVSSERSRKSRDSAAQARVGVFYRCSFYTKDKKLKDAAYNAVILLSKAYYRQI